MTGPRDGGGPLGVRLYRLLLGVLPTGLDEGLRAEAGALYHELLREARARRGRLAGLGVSARCFAGLLACVWSGRATGLGRGGRGPRWSDGPSAVARDVRHASRGLRRSPGFVAATVLIVAVGVGATATIFSVVDTVVLRPLPYPDADALVYFRNGAHSYPVFRSLHDLGSFESVAAARDYQLDLTGEGPPERIPAAAVSPAFFRMFGAAPYLGRLFSADEYPGDRSVAVIGHGLWTRLGADPALLGSTLRLDGAAVRLVGVMDPRFEPPVLATGSRVDVWLPLDEGGEFAAEHGYRALGVVARLAPGVGVQAAQAEVDAQRTALAREVPEQYVLRDGRVRMTPLMRIRQATVTRVSSRLFTLLGAVGLLLLIACANVANLFLARGTARAREVALRGALGASRGRIGRLVLTESLLLAGVGGALGVAVAYGGVDLFARFTPGEIPRLGDLSVDGRILGFSLLVTIVAGALFGSLPALQAMRANVSDTLKEGATSVSAGRTGLKVRSGLVVTEIALTVVLVAGAGLLIRSFVAVASVDPGFETSGLVVLPLALESEYDEEERTAFVAELLDGVEALPEAESVAVGWTTPFSRTGPNRCCWRSRVVGDPARVDDDRPYLSLIHPVSHGYFATLDAALVSGRDFAPRDGTAEERVAILNRAAAEPLFGPADPVGRTVELAGETLTVVGVVEGVHHWGQAEDVEAAVYVPYGPYGRDLPELEILLRTDASLAVAAEGLRSVIWSIDPDLPLGTATTMEARVSESLGTSRFYSGLLALFALVSLILACGGIYASMLYTVGQRRREMGIRLALGADAAAVIGLVLGYGIVLAIVGVGIGTLAGLALSGVMEQLVWGVPTTDPATFAATAVLLAATAVVASFYPAWRASRADPLQTLRAE